MKGSQAISWEEFNKYLKVGISIYAFTFVESALVDNNNATVKYFRTFEEYKQMHQGSATPASSYKGHFGDPENVEKILIREPLRLMKNLPPLESVKLYVPLDGKFKISHMTRDDAEQYFRLRLNDLNHSNNRWIKFVDRFILDPVKRKKSLIKFTIES